MKLPHNWTTGLAIVAALVTVVVQQCGTQQPPDEPPESAEPWRRRIMALPDGRIIESVTGERAGDKPLCAAGDVVMPDSVTAWPAGRSVWLNGNGIGVVVRCVDGPLHIGSFTVEERAP